MRTLLGPLTEKSSEYCSDAAIARYLAARNGHVKKATKMLKETLKWRTQYKPEEIRWVCILKSENIIILWTTKINVSKIFIIMWNYRKRFHGKPRPGRYTELIVPTSMEDRFWLWDQVLRFGFLFKFFSLISFQNFLLLVISVFVFYYRIQNLLKGRLDSWYTAWRTQSWTYRNTKNKWFG